MSRLPGLAAGYAAAKPRGTYLALALLTLCAVFAATAGVREALVTTTQALRQTLAAAPSDATDITVSGTQSDMPAALHPASPFGLQGGGLTGAQVAGLTRQLHADYDGYDHGAVKLAPAGDDWASLTSQPNTVQSPLPKVGGVPVKLEITDRQPLRRHMRLLAGSFPAAPPPAVPVPSVPSGRSRVRVSGGRPSSYTPLLQVVVTRQTAAAFGLRVGSTMTVPGNGPSTAPATVAFQVSGIVAPADPSSSFWTTDSAAAAPSLQNADSVIPPPYWIGEVIAGPGEAAAVQQDFPAGLTMTWGFPLQLGSVTGQQARPLSNALTSLTAQTPVLTGDLMPMASALSASANLLPTLGAYFATAQSVDVPLWLLYVSLTVTGLAVLLLAARMVAMRRSAELTVVRARGASLWQVGLATGTGAAAACVPAAAIAVALAVLAVHGAGSADFGSAAAWWPSAAVLVAVIAGPAVIAAWEHRPPGHRDAARRGKARRQLRLVVEVTLVAASVAGIVVFRQQGAAPGPGVNLYTSAAPVLVAVPVVIVVLRVYPLALHGLLRASARSSGAPAFLGLARAARDTLTPALPAFALVLALSVAAFAGMVRNAVTNGDVAASWRAVGADVTISAVSAFTNFSIPPSAVPAISAVPGVTHAAAEWPATWQAPSGSPVTVLAVDPASYAALIAAARGFPPMRPGLLAVPGTPGAAQPVLASPQAVAALGSGPVSISTQAAPLRPVKVKVAGVVSATPGWPAAGAFLIMPLAALTSSVTPPVPVPITELQLTGPHINRAQLDKTLQQDLPAGWTATFRSDVLSGMTGAPLQRGAFLLITLSVALAAVLGLAIMFLELALGAAEREATLARLATMGLGEGQRARIVALEVMPAVIAAAAAAWGCALALPWLVAPSVNLSVFSRTLVPVPLAPDVSNFTGAAPLVPDIASVALPLAGLLVIAAVTLGFEVRRGRRRGGAKALRIGG